MVMRTLTFLAVVLIIVAGAGCATKVNIEAEREALRRADSEYSNAATAKDVERLHSLYAEDATVYEPNAPAVTGREPVRKFISDFAALPGFAVTFRPLDV